MQKIVYAVSEKCEVNGEEVDIVNTKIAYVDKVSIIKEIPNFLRIISNEYVTHPTPSALQATITFFSQTTEVPLTLSTFYHKCAEAQLEIDKVEEELIASGDVAAIKRRDQRLAAQAKAAQAKAEREASKATESTGKTSKKKSITSK